jgi:tetratricopeptide (TPR) repeat protein
MSRLLPAILLLSLSTPAMAGDSAALREDFGEANALKDGDACDEAVIRYEELLGRLPEGSALRAPARYNQAVCLEEMGSPEAALENHRIVAEDPAAPDDLRRDARFRQAVVQIALDEDGDARRTLTKLLTALDASPMREVAWVHLAWLDIRAGRHRAAARRLAEAVPVLEAAHSVDDRQGLAVHLALASVAMGDLVAREALDTPLRGSPKKLRERLLTLGETAEAAEVYYVDAIRREDPTWAAAAALHLGWMYLRTYERLVELRRRLDDGKRGSTDPEARALVLWLRDRLDPTLLKARQALRLCSEIPLMTGSRNRFSNECKEQLGVPPF